MYHANIITDFYGEPNNYHYYYQTPHHCRAVVIIIGKKAITKLWIEKLLEDNFIEKSIVYRVFYVHMDTPSNWPIKGLITLTFKPRYKFFTNKAFWGFSHESFSLFWHIVLCRYVVRCQAIVFSSLLCLGLLGFRQTKTCQAKWTLIAFKLKLSSFCM